MSRIPTDELLKILADSQWHPLRDFLHLGHKYIRPEMASRADVLRRKGQPITVPIDQSVASGRQYCVTEALRQLSRRGLVKIEGVGFEKRYKLI